MYCLLFFVCLIFAVVSSLESNLPAAELNALQDLFDHTNGSNWQWDTTRNISLYGIPRSGIPWNFSGNYNPCHDNWQGLNCDCMGAQCHIIEIILSAHNLTGVLPNSMADFNYLQLLDFEANNLRGQVPNMLNCTSLRNIDLQRNNFTGPFPEWLLKVASLQYMDISINQFTGTIPAGVSQMTSVQQFVASFNSFTGQIPIELTQLLHLKLIVLKYNQLTGTIHYEFGLMPRLDNLQLARNLFTGTIPSFSDTSRLVYIDLSVNFLVGGIPSSFGALSNLTYLALFDNQLTGHISSSLTVQLTKLNDLYVDSNQFTGTLPLVTSKNMLAYELNNNSFTGSIPGELFDLEQLNFFDVSHNLIQGSLPDGFRTRNNVEHIAVNNNFMSGTLPATITNLTYLVDLLLYDNRFSGTLPKGMNNMHILESIMLQNNQFSGTLDHLINATAPLYFREQNEEFVKINNTNFQAINSIDVSSNRFTGSIPPQIFDLPHLLTFAAVSNCISGSLPENICNATLLQSLALDGLSTADQCHDKIFGNSHRLSAYLLRFSLQGGIPTCLYGMKTLQSLHLSGNGLTGSIPSDVVLGPVLTDLTLSHNGIRGSIPMTIQQRVWANLDLSYNKIGGVLDASFAFCGHATIVLLQVNRLSGVIPRNLTEGVDVTILQGNIFSCLLDKDTIPRADEDYANYECGSNSFYLSLLLWLFCFCLSCAAIALAVIQFRKNSTWMPQWAVVQYLGHILSQCAEWMAVYAVDPLEHFGHSNETNIFALGQFCSDVRLKTLLATLFLMFIVLPVYIVLTVPYQMYTFLYAWTASAMFLSGEIAALGMLAILTLYLLLVIYVGRSIVQAKYTQARSLQAVGKIESGWETSKRKLGYFLGLSPAVLVNCFAMVAVNLGYVYVTLHYDTITVSFAQIVLASFKLAWNEFAVRKLLTLSVRFLENRAAAAVAAAGTATAVTGVGTAGAHLVETSNFLRVIKEDIPFRTIILLFNNIATPCIAVAIVSPVCFFDLLFTPLTVDTSYQLCLDAVGSTNTETNRCKRGALTTFYTSYVPPFAYSYQCSSTFVQNYASMYVYMFLIIAFVTPLAYFVAKEVHEWTAQSQTASGKYLHKVCDYFLPALLKPLPKRLSDLLNKRKKYHRRGASDNEENFSAYQLDDLARSSVRSYLGGSSMGRGSRPLSMMVDMSSIRALSKNGLSVDTDHSSSPLSSAGNSPVAPARELAVSESAPTEECKAASAQLLGVTISDRATSLFRSSVSAHSQKPRPLPDSPDGAVKRGSKTVRLNEEVSKGSLAVRPLPELPAVTPVEQANGFDDPTQPHSRPTSVRMSSVGLSMFTSSWVERKSVQRAHGSTTSTISGAGTIRNRSDTVNSTITSSTHASMSKHSSVSGRLRSFINKNSPKSRKRDDTRTIFFSKGRFILRIVTEVATLLTFGAVFPPLAVVICVSMFSYTLFTQLLVGRFLIRAQKHRDYGEIRRILETECHGVSTQLIESFGYLVFFAALFYACFVFDTLGDVSDSAIHSAWIAVLMVIMPGLLYVLWLGAHALGGMYERSVRYNANRKKRHSAPEVVSSGAGAPSQVAQKKGVSSEGHVQVAESVDSHRHVSSDEKREGTTEGAVDNPIIGGSNV